MRYWQIMLALALAQVGWGQGYTVQPMRIEVSPTPGTVVEQEITLRNGTPNALTMSAKPVWLGQNQQGNWIFGDPDERKEPAPTHDCVRWLKVNDEESDVLGLQSKMIKMSVSVPRGVYGFHCAAVLVTARLAKPDPKGMGIVLQFLVPVLAHVPGGQARERITLTDTLLRRIEAAEEQTPTTLGALCLRNEGNTYTRISGTVAVYSAAGAEWRRVTEVEIPERGMIPGANVELAEDLQRRLPSGNYRLRATLRQGGRVKSSVEREVAFVGDPGVTGIAADVPLIIEPLEITASGVPGGQRSAVLMVKNPTDEPVTVACRAETPATLAGVNLGAISGDSFSCAAWTTLSAGELTLNPGERRNLRVQLNYPAAPTAPRPCYYADLRLTTTYADGQGAGTAVVPITFQDTAQAATPRAQIERVSLAQQEGDKYTVTAKVANIGNVHLTPLVTATLHGTAGDAVGMQPLQSSTERLLPLATPQYTGALDFATVAPGNYLLTVTMRYADKEETKQQLSITVTDTAQGKQVTVNGIEDGEATKAAG